MVTYAENIKVIYKYFRSSQSSEYVFHPINAFHLLKRFSDWMPRILPFIPDYETSMQYNLGSLKEDVRLAAHGIADIYEYSELAPRYLANGTIKLLGCNKTYFANSKLSLEELEIIAIEALNANYIGSYIEWLRAIIDIAEKANQPLNIIETYM